MKKKIVYASCTCSDDMFEKMYLTNKKLPGQAVQKYHRLLAKGLALNDRDVTMVSFLSLNRASYNKLYFPRYAEHVECLNYRYIPEINVPILKNIMGVVSTYKEICSVNAGEEIVIFCDVLNVSVSWGAVLAAKKIGCSCIGIVTDVPELLCEKTKSLFVKLNNYIIRNCSGYILLTQAMNSVINKNDKPYIVLEGHTDVKNYEFVHQKREGEPYVVLYAGSLHETCGIKELIEGYIKADLQNSELWIYGSGNCEQAVIDASKKYDVINYGGVIPNRELVKKLSEADLLINPRSTTPPYVKYSFPSKNLEYMFSGTPFMTTKLPGMPKEYEDYVYLIEDESVDGIANALRKVYNINIVDQQAKGKSAQQFVAEKKNCVVQAKKILERFEI